MADRRTHRPRRRPPRLPCRRRDERGTGLLGSVLGVAIVTALAGVAANVALGLWVRSTVDSVAYDAARRVATAPSGSDESARRRDAIESARRLLGRHGDRVVFEFVSAPGADPVVLRVRSPGVSLLPRLVDGGPTVGAVDRRIVVTDEAPS